MNCYELLRQNVGKTMSVPFEITISLDWKSHANEIKKVLMTWHGRINRLHFLFASLFSWALISSTNDSKSFLIILISAIFVSWFRITSVSLRMHDIGKSALVVVALEIALKLLALAAAARFALGFGIYTFSDMTQASQMVIWTNTVYIAYSMVVTLALVVWKGDKNENRFGPVPQSDTGNAVVGQEIPNTNSAS